VRVPLLTPLPGGLELLIAAFRNHIPDLPVGASVKDDRELAAAEVKISLAFVHRRRIVRQADLQYIHGLSLFDHFETGQLADPRKKARPLRASVGHAVPFFFPPVPRSERRAPPRFPR